MKINNGYVTNSSSTSFVVCTKNGVSREKFLGAFGVNEDSLLRSFYEKLYYAIQKEKKEIPAGINLREYALVSSAYSVCVHFSLHRRVERLCRRRVRRLARLYKGFDFSVR